jgi:cation transport regulator ChaC
MGAGAGTGATDGAAAAPAAIQSPDNVADADNATKAVGGAGALAVVAPALAAAAAASLVEQVAVFLGGIGAGRDVVLFAYGSLIWRPEPAFDAGVPCVAHGFIRRFWQLSDDHRGTAAAPGRACTLLAAASVLGDGGGGGGGVDVNGHDGKTAGSGAPGRPTCHSEATCAGQLYIIPAALAREALEQLAVREKAGYSLVGVTVTLADGSSRAAVAFAADNGAGSNAYLVPQGAGRSIAATAEVIMRARGKSGTNVDYFRELLGAMRARGVHDAHLEAIDAHILAHRKALP